MRRIVFGLVLALPLHAYAAETIIFPASFSFGQTTTPSAVDASFWIRSAAEDSCLITEIKTSCGCAISDLPSRLLLPGDSLPLRVQWRLDSTDSLQRVKLYLFIDGQLNPFTLLLDVNDPRSIGSVRALPSRAELGPSSSGVTIALINPDSVALTVSIVGTPDERLELSIPDSLLPLGSSLCQIGLRSSRLELTSSITLEFSANGKKAQRLTIPIEAALKKSRNFLTKSR